MSRLVRCVAVVARAVGRRDEIERIVAAMDEARFGTGRIVELAGEAGIGKSTVLAAVASRATESGWRVWQTAPTAAEAGLPWTGLAQIVNAVASEDLDALSPRHREQLASATSADRSGIVSPELVAFATSALLDTAIGPNATPLLMVVDDLHWLDAASSGALAYAMRGMEQRCAVAVLSRRSDEPALIEPERLVDNGAFTRIELAGLDLASLRESIADASGVSLGRAEFVRIAQYTGGNPLYGAELARSVAAGTPIDATALPASLRDSVGARVSNLPMATRRALAAAALAVRPTLDLLSVALSDVDLFATLEPAEAAGIAALRSELTSAGSRVVVFGHPLLAAAAIDTLPSRVRRDIHLAMAASTDDIVERATHLMAAAVGPDESIAGELARAALDAHERGASEAAVTLARASVDLTPATVESLVRLERVYAFARFAVHAGRYPDADSVIATLRQGSDPRNASTDVDASALHDLRERVALVDASVASNLRGYPAAEGVIEQALVFTTDLDRRDDLQRRLARIVVHQDACRGVEVAERAFGDHRQLDRPGAVAGRMLLLLARAVAGEPFDVDAGIALVEAVADDPLRRELEYLLIEPLVWSDHPRTEEIAEPVVARELADGRIPAYLVALHEFTEHLLVRGQWARAEDNMARLGEYRWEFPGHNQARASHALLLAGRGDGAGALALLERLSSNRDAEPADSELVQLWVDKQAALVDHTLGRPGAADALVDVERRYAQHGVGSVRFLHFRRDLVEALVAAGRLGDASAAADRLSRDARHNQVPTAVADADAAAGVIAAAQGDDVRARALFDDAAAVQRAYDLRYELARTLLAAGAAARRAKRRTDAGELLGESRQLFEAMGAATWVRRCDEERERLGGRRSMQSAELTATELQVAELVASGCSNAEVANAMFVSVRTVESNLSRIYRKLGIRSRGALARTLETRGRARGRRPHVP